MHTLADNDAATRTLNDRQHPARATGSSISQDQRWAHAARLLHDDALDPTNRVAGRLLLLTASPYRAPPS